MNLYKDGMKGRYELLTRCNNIKSYFIGRVSAGSFFGEHGVTVSQRDLMLGDGAIDASNKELRRMVLLPTTIHFYCLNSIVSLFVSHYTV
jgi:hypothetical protein